MTTPFDQFPDAASEGPSGAKGADSTVFGAFPDAETEMPPSTEGQQNPGVRVDHPGWESFGAGAVDSSMIGPGIAAGVKLGQPGGAWGMAAGGVAGAVAGAMAGPEVRKMIGLRTPDEMAPDQRPLGKAMYSLGGGAVLAGTPFGLVRTAVTFLDVGVGKFINNMVRQAAQTPVRVAAIEGTGVAFSAAGAGMAEVLAPGSQLAAIAGEVGGGMFNPVGRAVTAWNFGTAIFERAMKRYGRNAQEVKFGKDMVNGIANMGGDPEAVIKVLEAGNPYGLTAAQLTADDFLIATERALTKSSDPFSRAVMEKGRLTRDAMTAQINMLKASGDPQFLADIAQLRKAQFDSLMEDRLKVAMMEAKSAVQIGVRKGLKDADLPEISRRARKPLDDANQAAMEESSRLFDAVSLEVPVEMKNLRAAVDQILAKSADPLKPEKIPRYLREALDSAEKNRASGFSYDPDTFVIGSTDAGPLMTDSRSMMDYRRKLLAVASDPNGNDYDKGIAKVLQSAVMDDLDAGFKEGVDASYDKARAFYKSYKDVFERTFVGDALALKKRGDAIDPSVLLDRAFATGKQAANIKLTSLENATRFTVSRGLGDPGAVETMLDAQESAYRIIATSAMKDGRINPDAVTEMIRTNGVLFNRPPFNEVRDDLLKAIKSEQGLARLEDFATRRNRDIGKKSAMAQITGTDPVAYASKILVSTGKQEDELIKMFNLAKKGGTNRQGVMTITPEQGVSSARATVLNAAFNRSMTGGNFDLDKFRGLLFTPNVAGNKSVITIMREQGVIDPEHVTNLSKMFNALDNLKKAERQGTAIEVEKGLGEMGVILLAKVFATKALHLVQRMTKQSGSSIVLAGAVTNAAERVVSKIPAARAKDMAVLLFNDPKALALVMRKETDPSKRMLQIRTFHSWLVNSGITHTRESLTTEYDDTPQMFSQ